MNGATLMCLPILFGDCEVNFRWICDVHLHRGYSRLVEQQDLLYFRLRLICNHINPSETVSTEMPSIA